MSGGTWPRPYWADTLRFPLLVGHVYRIATYWTASAGTFKVVSLGATFHTDTLAAALVGAATPSGRRVVLSRKSFLRGSRR
jgi:hypothetical protein